MAIINNMLTKVTGTLGTKVIIGIIATVFVVMVGTIWYQYNQKTNLRDDIKSLNGQIVASEVSYEMCLITIDDLSVDHNNQLLNMVNREKLDNEIMMRKLSDIKHNAIMDSIRIQDKHIEAIDIQPWSKETLPKEILEIVNENITDSNI